MRTQDFEKAAPALKALCEKTDTLADLLDVEIAAAKSIGSEDLVREAEKLKNHFSYMLKYLVSNDIPDIDTATDDLLLKARKLQRQILREYNVEHSSRSYYAAVRFQRLRPEENLESLVSDYLSELERRSNDPTSMMSNNANARLEELSNDIFERIRTLFSFSEHVDLIESLIFDPSIPNSDRILWTGAIGLGILEVYDSSRAAFLMHLLADAAPEVQVAAAVWLVVALAAYLSDIPHNRQVFPFPELEENPNRQLFFDALFEMLKLCTFDKLDPKEKEKIIPSIESMIKNLNLPKDAASMKEMMNNPENITASTKAYEFVHRLNEAIRKGYDVQASSLGKLRHWPFFGKVGNWLLPFDPNHSSLAGIADEEGAPIADMLTRMGTLIDSDKYALILSLSNIPASMRESALQGTMNQMGSNTDEFYEALNDEAKEAAKMRNRINNYSKQVWRLLSTFPKHDEFRLFDWDDLVEDMTILSSRFLSDDMLRQFGLMMLELKDADKAEYYFEKIQEKTDEDLRNWALSSVMNRNHDAENVTEYLQSNPGDIDFLIECVRLDCFNEHLLEAFQFAEDIDPENIPFLKAYVKVLNDFSLFSEAADRLVALEYLDADNSAEHRKKRAQMLVYAGQWAEALEALEGALISGADTVATAATALWMTSKRGDALKLLEANKNLSDLNDALVHFVNSNPCQDNRQRALLHYLLDAWQYILNDTNPLNI